MTKRSERKSEGARLSALLRRLADVVEGLSSEDVEAVIGGSAEIQVQRVRPRSRRGGGRSRKAGSDQPCREVVETLRTLGEREAGESLLRSKCPTKASIEQLARFLDLPVTRDDTADTLYERVVESEIGSRLRSEAVQGR